MRTQIIEGHTVLTVNWYDEDDNKDVVNIVKLGRRVRVTTCDVAHIKNCLLGLPTFEGWYACDVSDIDKNVEVGPKTLATVLEDALLYGHSKGKVDSDYMIGPEPDKLAVERAGTKRVRFTAPCGQQGTITNGEATKLIAALRSL